MAVNTLNPKGQSLQVKTVVVSEQTQAPAITLKNISQLIGIVVNVDSTTVAGALSVGVPSAEGTFATSYAFAPGDAATQIGANLYREALRNSQDTAITATVVGAGAGPVHISFLYVDEN